MSIFWDKLAHVQVVINCRYYVAQMCTGEDMLVHNLGAPYFDDVMSYNALSILQYYLLIILSLQVSPWENGFPAQRGGSADQLSLAGNLLGQLFGQNPLAVASVRRF